MDCGHGLAATRPVHLLNPPHCSAPGRRSSAAGSTAGTLAKMASMSTLRPRSARSPNGVPWTFLRFELFEQLNGVEVRGVTEKVKQFGWRERQPKLGLEFANLHALFSAEVAMPRSIPANTNWCKGQTPYQ